MVKNLVIKCRGLPYSCTEDDLKGFLGDSGIDKVDLPMRDGKAMGEASVYYNNDRDYNEALKKDHEHMGHRWIEVFPADEDGSKRRPPPRGERPPRGGGAFESRSTERYGRYGEACVRLRGLPYNARESDLFDFFHPLPVLPDGILLADDPKSKNGEAFVVFEDERAQRSAKMLHMKSMGHRYIEVFETTYSDMTRFCHDNGLRVPRPPPGGSSRAAPGPAPFESGYSPAFAAPAGPDYGRAPERRSGGPAPFESYNNPPAQDAYSAYGYSRPEPPRADPYARPDDPYARPPAGADPYAARAADPYGRREDPYARPAAAPRGYDDPYSRGGSGYGGAAGGGDPYSRPVENSWRDGDGGSAPRASGLESYGYGQDYQQSQGGGPMKRESAPAAWRGADYDRPPQAEVPRSRDRPGQRYVLKMRGVPFRAVETDVYDFFEPIRPVRVEIVREPGGRPSGEARVEFETRKDYDDALLKDKQYMGSRYVELFPDFGGRY